MLVQRRRRSADVVQIIYKCFVFAGYLSVEINLFLINRADDTYVDTF